MKKNIVYHSFIFAIILIVSGCQDKFSETFMANSPVYLSYKDLRSSVKKENTRTIEHPGKIYFKDDYLFINEQFKGVHVIDVSNPSSPENIGFIDIPGNVDIAIKEDVLYADSYVDLVAIDVSDLNNVKEVGRIEDIFPYTLPEFDTEYRTANVDKERGVVIRWEVKKIEQEIENNYYPIYYRKGFYENYALDAFSFSSAGGVGGGSGTTFGVGGSMARFGLYKDYLYTVDQSNLYTFDIETMESPKKLDSKSIGWNVETMFIYDDHLFFGTTSGMLIYSLEIERSPRYVNQYNHITSCDPVVVQDHIAYVTLHDGGSCGRSVNRLDVIQMNDDYSKLELKGSQSMANPHGLGIDDEVLFVCDGDAGLKVFNVPEPLTMPYQQIAQFPDINTYDVIPMGNYLFMIGSGGFYLYDYSNLQDIKLLSTIPVSTVNN